MRSPGATRLAASVTVVTFDAESLGDRSYLVSDGELGVVVDPQRDPLAYLQQADKLGVSIVAVLETHIHNDYVSGGLALARATGATYGIPTGEPVSFADECRYLDDGDTLRAGRLEVTAIATPGHTDHHLAYRVAIVAEAAGDEEPDCVICTGGSLLLDAAGRTDLLGEQLAESLARAQWRSVRHLLSTLPAGTRVLPTHGFGSFCSATPAGGASGSVGTISEQLAQNPAALLGEDEFVATVLADPPPIPAYYRYMAPLNRKGAAAPLFEPVPALDTAGVAEALQGPRWVVDMRQRRVFAAGHLPGSLNLELGPNLTTYLGWLVPFEAEIVLVGEDQGDITEARRLIAAIGREDLAAAATFAAAAGTHAGTAAGGAGLGSYPVASFFDLAEAWNTRPGGELEVFDVRHPHEWRAGHLAGARHVPVQVLATEKPELAGSGQIWVHCAAGFRAAAAASLLSGWGYSPVLVDDTFEHAVASGLPIETDKALPR
jgi:glyoxylase-like metal-dependent hydrolase (beta-lactamase superfamily II)/rhodanese-related sulfurtransferase